MEHRYPPPTRASQRGLSVFGLLFFCAVAIVLVLFGMKLVKPITEYFAIESVVQRIGREGGSVAEIRSAFDRNATTNDITSIAGKDLDISKVDDRVVISYAYSYQVPVLDNVRLVIDFAGSNRERGGKAAR